MHSCFSRVTLFLGGGLYFFLFHNNISIFSTNFPFVLATKRVTFPFVYLLSFSSFRRSNEELSLTGCLKFRSGGGREPYKILTPFPVNSEINFRQNTLCIENGIFNLLSYLARSRCCSFVLFCFVCLFIWSRHAPLFFSLKVSFVLVYNIDAF